MIKTSKLEAIKDTLLNPENLGTHFYALENIKGFNFSITFNKDSGLITCSTKSKGKIINFASNRYSVKALRNIVDGENLTHKLVDLINIKYPENNNVEFFFTMFSAPGTNNIKSAKNANNVKNVVMYDILVDSKFEDYDNVLDYCALMGIKTNPIIKIVTNLDAALDIPANGDSMIPYLFNNSSELVPMQGVTIRPHKEIQYKIRSKNYRLIIDLADVKPITKTNNKDSEFLKFLNKETLNVVKSQNPKNLESELIYYIIEKLNPKNVEEINNIKAQYTQKVRDFITINS